MSARISMVAPVPGTVPIGTQLFMMASECPCRESVSGRLPTRGDPAFVVGIISSGHFLSHVYLLAYPPLFPILGAEFDVSTTQLGLLVTAIYVPTLLFQVPLGDIVDRIGAKRVLTAGMVVTALGITLSGLAPAYGFLLACAFVSGIGQSVFHPANYAFLETVTEDGTEGKAFSAHTFGGFAGFAAAPVIIGTLGIMYSWQFALLTVGSIGFLFAAFLYTTTEPVHYNTIQIEPSPGSDSSFTLRVSETLTAIRAFLDRDLVLVFMFYLVSMMAIVGLQSFTTVLGVSTFGFTESAANTVLTAYLVATAIGVIAGGPLADFFPVERVILGLFTVAASGVGIIVATAPAPGFLAVIFVFAIVGGLMGAALPSRDKLANSFADPTATGKSFGFFFTGLSLGAVIAPVIIGSVIDAVSAAAAFGIIAGFLLGAAAVVLLLAFRADRS